MVDDHRNDHNEKEGRESDPRVPLIFALFFLCCLTGGILLILWLADVGFSRPWFPTLAYVFIGFPWIFWSLTYIYTLIKGCFPRYNNCGGGGAAKPAPVATTAKNNRGSTPAPALDSPAKSAANGKQVHFGAVVVMDDGSRSGGENGGRPKDGDRDLSVASSQDSETPFVLSVSS